MDTIAFREIAYTVQRPGEYVEISPNYSNLGILPFPTRALILAQKIAAGTAAIGTIYNITRKLDATALFGAGSQAETMAWAFLAANRTIPLDVIAVADAGGAVAATGAFAITAPATGNGTPAVSIGGRRYFVGTVAADTAPTTAAEFVAAINADPQAVVVAVQGAGGAANLVNLTAKNVGAEGNNIDLFVSPAFGDILPLGMTISITPMASGATNPTIAAALTAIGNLWYSDIAMPWQDSTNLGLLAAELGRRFNAMVMRDGVGYVCFTGTYSQQIAKIAAANSKFLFSIPVTNPPTVPWAWAASLMGVASGKLNDDPSRQLRGLVLPGIVGPRPPDRRTDIEEELLLEAGGTTFHITRTGAVVLQRVVSLYLVNDAGVNDPAYHDIMEIKVATRIRHDWHGYFALMYPSNKLADDGSLAAQYDTTVVTPGRAKGSYTARMQLWGQLGWVEDTVNQARNSTFVRDVSDRNRLNSRMLYTRVGNMMVLAAQLQFNV